MEGYFLNDAVPLKNGPNFFVISQRDKFIKYFGLFNKPDTPNFDFSHVIVMALRPSKKPTTIAFMPTAAKAGDYIEVYCEVGKQEKHALTYTCYPIVVAAIPKYRSVKKINFYNNQNKKLIETVEIK